MCSSDLVKQVAAGDESGDGAETVVRGDLMWTVRDNGSDVDWNEAKAYCEACRVGGYSDWRMPTIEELQGLYVKGNSYPPRDEMYHVHIARPFILTTPWIWSSTLDGSSSAFDFAFDRGGWYSVDLAYRDGGRVLCVRRSGPDEAEAESDSDLPKFGDYVYVEVLPEAITRVPPNYPEAARHAAVEGTVMLQALIGKDGRVRAVRVRNSIPMLDDAAMAAVRQWVFKPALSNGQPVAVWVGVPVTFTLH